MWHRELRGVRKSLTFLYKLKKEKKKRNDPSDFIDFFIEPLSVYVTEMKFICVLYKYLLNEISNRIDIASPDYFSSPTHAYVRSRD